MRHYALRAGDEEAAGDAQTSEEAGADEGDAEVQGAELQGEGGDAGSPTAHPLPAVILPDGWTMTDWQWFGGAYGNKEGAGGADGGDGRRARIRLTEAEEEVTALCSCRSSLAALPSPRFCFAW